jgi:hypothetical protein
MSQRNRIIMGWIVIVAVCASLGSTETNFDTLVIEAAARESARALEPPRNDSRALTSASNHTGPEPPQCVEQDDCNTAFFKLDNYCCTGHCCNYIEFVFKQPAKSVFSNFAYTLDHPRVINVIIGYAGTLLVILSYCVLVSIMRCVCRGCHIEINAQLQ